MPLHTREYEYGTNLVVDLPFGLYRTGNALCPDGKVRKLKRISESADTFFSVPAAVRYKGKTVSGFVSIRNDEGRPSSLRNHSGEYVAFVPYNDGANASLFRKESR